MQPPETSEKTKKNATHATGPPGSKQWTTIADFSDLKNRIRCLLIQYTNPLSILVSFDFDGTLGARRSVVSSGQPKEHPLSRQDTFDQEMLSVDILQFLNAMGVPFFVNTAASNPCRAHEAMSQNHHYTQPRPAPWIVDAHQRRCCALWRRLVTICRRCLQQTFHST